MKFRMLRLSILSSIVMWVIVSCSPGRFNTKIVHLPTPNPSAIVITSPEIITHSRPNLNANTQVLKDAGCIEDPLISYVWNCKNNSRLMALGCREVYPEDLLAGLTPDYPVMGCSPVNREPLNKWRFYRAGCMTSFYTSHVIFKNGEYRLITEESELKSTFAPIESADEALGYAIIATNLVANYRKDDDDELRHVKFFVNKYEDTHVDETSKGYVVHLFSMPTPQCYCQIHTTYLVDILVTKDGKVQQLNATQAYSDYSCID